MKIPAKRLLSMLMVFVMVLGIFPRVMATETIEGIGSITEEPGVLSEAWQIISDSQNFSQVRGKGLQNMALSAIIASNVSKGRRYYDNFV